MNIITKKQFTAIKKAIGNKRAYYTLALCDTGFEFIAMYYGIIELATARIGAMAGDIQFYDINIDKMAALVTKLGSELTYDDVNVYCDGMIIGDKKEFSYSNMGYDQRVDLSSKISYHLPRLINHASNDETRYFMTGVSFEISGSEIVLAATDGRQLMHTIPVTISGTVDNSLIIPCDFLKNIGNNDFSLLYSDDNTNICVDWLNDGIFYSLAGKRIDGQFPGWRRVVPDSSRYTNSFLVDTKKLTVWLKKISAVVSADSDTKKTRRCSITISKTGVECFGQIFPCVVKNDISETYDVNIDYLLGLYDQNNETTTIIVTGQKSPFISPDGETLSVFMVFDIK